MMSMCKIHIITDMAILEIFGVFGDRMANLSLNDFKLGLYIKVNVNLKFISQKIWPK